MNLTPDYAVGIDIGGTKILLIITDRNGTVVYKDRFNTPADIGEMMGKLHDSLEKSGISEERILALGAGIPSITDSAAGLVLDAPALGWQNVPLGEMLQEEFPIPVFINNDVNCAALGERWLGAGANSENMVFIAFGTGVGCGVVCNGRLVEGHRYSSGEIGYFIDLDDVEKGLVNSIGSFGTFENKTSGTGLARYGMPAEELFRQYAEGNPEAVRILEKFILHVSIALANISSLLNPEKIILGGGVGESFPIILEKVKANVSRFTPIAVEVELASLGTEAGAFGAAAYAMQKLE